jgi:hypothetical protein
MAGHQWLLALIPIAKFSLTILILPSSLVQENLEWILCVTKVLFLYVS